MIKKSLEDLFIECETEILNANSGHNSNTPEIAQRVAFLYVLNQIDDRLKKLEEKTFQLPLL